MIVHGGAGGGAYAVRDRRFKELRSAVRAGLEAMRKGGSLDGVQAAVASMEECGAFNAGRGACLTALGEVQLDAAVMTGKERGGAGVGACTCTYHPVTLARNVMERTSHVLIVGEYCRIIAQKTGMSLEQVMPSANSRKRFLELKKVMRRTHPRTFDLLRSSQDGNTVGAVALDRDGVPSAAVSTGGVWMKLPGRVGDSAVLGAGVYADNETGAACATGTGEEIIKCALALSACGFLKRKGAMGAAEAAISLIGKKAGENTAGIITVDLKGRLGYSYNTKAMGRAWLDASSGKILAQA